MSGTVVAQDEKSGLITLMGMGTTPSKSSLVSYFFSPGADEIKLAKCNG